MLVLAAYPLLFLSGSDPALSGSVSRTDAETGLELAPGGARNPWPAEPTPVLGDLPRALKAQHSRTRTV